MTANKSLAALAITLMLAACSDDWKNAGINGYEDSSKSDAGTTSVCVHDEIKVDDSREFRGLCKPKIESCQNGTWIVVQDEVRSVAEVPCNGHDDDCDGFIDEDTSCGGGNNPTTGDVTAPVLVITTATNQYITTASYPVIGYASDANSTIKSVSASVFGGTGQNVTVTVDSPNAQYTTWTALVPLVLGSNLVEVKAVDSSNNSTTKYVTLIYQPGNNTTPTNPTNPTNPTTPTTPTGSYMFYIKSGAPSGTIGRVYNPNMQTVDGNARYSEYTNSMSVSAAIFCEGAMQDSGNGEVFHAIGKNGSNWSKDWIELRRPDGSLVNFRTAATNSNNAAATRYDLGCSGATPGTGTTPTNPNDVWYPGNSTGPTTRFYKAECAPGAPADCRVTLWAEADNIPIHEGANSAFVQIRVSPKDMCLGLIDVPSGEVVQASTNYGVAFVRIFDPDGVPVVNIETGTPVLRQSRATGDQYRSRVGVSMTEARCGRFYTP